MKHHWVFLLLSNLPTAAAADAAGGGAPALPCPPAPQISGAWTLPTQPVPVVLGPGPQPALTLPPTAGTAVVADATADATHQRSDHEAESTDHGSNHEAAADAIATDHGIADAADLDATQSHQEAADATVIATHEEADGTNDEAGGPTDREAAEATNDEAGATGPAQDTGRRRRCAAALAAAAAAESAAAPPHSFIQTPMTPMTMTRVVRACAKSIGDIRQHQVEINQHLVQIEQTLRQGGRSASSSSWDEVPFRPRFVNGGNYSWVSAALLPPQPQRPPSPPPPSVALVSPQPQRPRPPVGPDPGAPASKRPRGSVGFVLPQWVPETARRQAWPSCCDPTCSCRGPGRPSCGSRSCQPGAQGAGVAERVNIADTLAMSETVIHCSIRASQQVDASDSNATLGPPSPMSPWTPERLAPPAAAEPHEEPHEEPDAAAGPQASQPPADIDRPDWSPDLAPEP
jgi:hypothetical protein